MKRRETNRDRGGAARAAALLLFPLALAATGCEGNAAASATAVAPRTEPAGAGPRVVKLAPALEERLGVRTALAGDAATAAAVTVPGSLEYDPDAYAEVGPRLDGRVTALHARLGDRVKKGDLLVELVVPSVADAQAAVAVAGANRSAAEKNAARERDLATRGLTTAREVEVAEAELARARAEHAAASTRLMALGADGPAARGALWLRAPIDGVVVERRTALGAFLSASSDAFVVADTSRLVAVLDVNEADLPYLAIGASVRFEADGAPGRSFTGTLAHLEPSIGKTTRLARARVAAPNPDGALRPGMFVRASIAAADRPGGGVALPAEAVQPLGRDDVAFVAKGDGAYEVRVLRVARRTAELVEVSSGVARGEPVAVEGAFLLRAEASKQ